MKKILSFVLIVVLCLPLFTGCSEENTVTFDLGYEEKTLSVKEDADGTVSIPAVPLRDGYSFRGWFSEPDGAGVRIVDTTPVESITSVYAYWTETQEVGEGFMFGAFGTFPYDHSLNESGQEIGYKGYEDGYIYMKDCGIDFAMIDYAHDGGYYESIAKENIDFCEMYGINYLVFDSNLLNETLPSETVKSYTSPYASSPFFLGVSLADEPGISDLMSLRYITENIRAACPEIDCHVNLAPLALIPDRNIYNSYLEKFAKYGGADHICSDPYAFYNAAGRDLVQEEFLFNQYLIAKSARDNDLELWTYIWTTTGAADSGGLVLSYNDVAYSMYSAILFGTRKIVLFMYNMTHDNGPTDTTVYGCFNFAYERTELWYYCQDIIEEMKTFSDVYAEYTWSKAGSFIPEGVNAEACVDKLIDYYLMDKDAMLLQDLNSSKEISIGDYVQTNGTGAAAAVFNGSSLVEDKDADVSFRILNAVNVTAYLGGESVVLEADENGLYHITVPCAEAAFITFDYYD